MIYIRSQKGIALMLTLWLMIFLAIIAAQFTISSRTEMEVAQNFTQEAKCYYLAKAGVSLAVAEIMDSRNKYAYLDLNGNLLFGRTEGEDPTAEDSTHQVDPSGKDIKFGGGSITYKISDESGKIPLNKIADLPLRKLLAYVGMDEGGADQNAAADSIQDWIDTNDLIRLNGAEDEYYEELDPSYKCKNFKFEFPEELLKVKGITPEIFKKLIPVVTVFSDIFNENTASCDLLKIWNGWEDGDDEKCLGRYDDDGLPKNKKWSSSIFTIVSTGKIVSKGEKTDNTVKRTVTAVIVVENTATLKSLAYKFWNDNLIEEHKEKS